MSFGVLTLIVLAGLAGPLLGGARRVLVPVVVGELLAGAVLGRSGFDVIDPADPTTRFLGDIGFAMLMFSVGAHLPLRDPALPTALRGGALAAGVVMALAPLGGILAAWFAGTGDAALYAVVLGSGSVAVVLPMVTEARLTDPRVLTVVGQVTTCDILTILAIPLVLHPDRAANAAAGAGLVALGALVVLLAAHRLHREPWVHRLRQRSKHRRWALDLRLALLVLFGLSWAAEKSGTSVLVAGFGTGLLVAALGGPKRLSTEVRGLADGFFVPLFFVLLGARLELGALVGEPSLLRLAVGLLVLNLAAHALAGRLTGQGAAASCLASAQLGVPAAVVALGLEEGLLSAAQGAAIMTAALASIAVAALGATVLARAAGPPAARTT